MKISSLALALMLTPFFSISGQAQTAYADSQDLAIKTFEKLGNELSSGTIPTESISFDDATLRYLSGVYLYCSIKNGICPLILNAILETDIIESQKNKKADCPNMLRFWRQWLNNGLEDRINYSLGTGFLTKYIDFKENTRPKYLKCSATVAQAIEPNTPLEEFAKARYENDSEHTKVISTIVAYLSALKDQVPDVFIATGAYKAQKDSSSLK